MVDTAGEWKSSTDGAFIVHTDGTVFHDTDTVAELLNEQAAELRELRSQNEHWQRAYDLGMVRARPPWWRNWFRA